MADSEYQATLHSIVNEVDRIVTSNSTARDIFTGHIDRLCKMVEDYGQAQQPYAQQLEKAEKQVKNFTPKQLAKYRQADGTIRISLNDFCPLPKGYEKVDYWENEFVNIPMGVIYRPSRPVNPLPWFGFIGSARIQREPTEDEKLMCQYVLLAIVHDYELRFSGTPTDYFIYTKDYEGKWFQWKKFCEEVWIYYHYPVQEITLHRHTTTPQEKLSQLNRAFSHVHADIAIQADSGKPGMKKKSEPDKPEDALQSKLSQIANEVDLIISNPISKEYFLQKLKSFNKTWRKLYLDESGKPKLQIVLFGTPRHSEPVNNKIVKIHYKNPLTQVPNRLEAYYAILSVIYDLRKAHIAPIELCKGIDESAFSMIEEAVTSSRGIGFGCDELNTVFIHVKGDIETQLKAMSENVGNQKKIMTVNPCHMEALNAFLEAKRVLSTDDRKECYDWICQNKPDGYFPPIYKTWKRYVNHTLQAAIEHTERPEKVKLAPRDTSKSILKKNALECDDLSEVTNQLG